MDLFGGPRDKGYFLIARETFAGCCALGKWTGHSSQRSPGTREKLFLVCGALKTSLWSPVKRHIFSSWLG